MSAKDDNNRTERLNVRLQSNLMSRLDDLSVEMGLPPATLGALAIAEYVNAKVSQKEHLRLTAQMTAENNSLVLREFLSDPDMVEQMSAAIVHAEENFKGSLKEI